MKIFDITPPITPNLKVWPKDNPLTREILCDMKKGDNITLSTLRATVHLGAHADGPNHYGKDAPSIDQQSLDHYIGPCQIVKVSTPRNQRVKPDDIKSPITAPRILIATNTIPNYQNWNEDFAALSPELVDWLAAKKVITIGIDTPSVDLFNSKDLPAHNAFLRNNMAILEGLLLKDVPEGSYELIALPLPLVGFDASPVRAILRSM